MEENENMLVIECPNCGQKMEYVILNALNTKTDAYEKQRLLDGTLFEVECRKCGKTIDLLHEMIYYDVEHNVAIYLVPEDLVDGVCLSLRLDDHLIEKILTDEQGNVVSDTKSRKRVVSCSHRLREKAIIFDNDLDDRIIELIKLICIEHTSDSIPDFKPLGAFFNIKDDGTRVIELIGEEKSISAIIPEGLYETLQVDFAEELAKDNEYVIDNVWAAEVMGSDNDCYGDCENCGRCVYDDEADGYDEYDGTYCDDCEQDCEDCNCLRCQGRGMEDKNESHDDLYDYEFDEEDCPDMDK